MPLTDAEFGAILDDETKRVRGDITWKKDEDRSSALEFQVEIESATGWPLFVKGRYNPAAGKLTYALILRTRAASMLSIWAGIITIRNANRSGRSTNISGRSVIATRKHMYRMT